MKISSQNFRVIFLILFLIHSVFNMWPRDYGVLIAIQVHGLLTLLISINILAIFFEAKSTKSLIFNALSITCIIAEIIAGAVAFFYYKELMFDDIPIWLKLFIGMPTSFAVLLSFFTVAFANTKRNEKTADAVTDTSS